MFLNNDISEDIKKLSYEICDRHNINIKYLETDENHIHYMLELETNISISKVVNLIKSYTTYHIWEKYSNYLSKHFWSDGYFVSSIGEVSEEILHKYIENQG